MTQQTKDAFEANMALWKGTGDLVKPYPDFTVNDDIKRQLRAAAKKYIAGQIQIAAQELYTLNCSVRNLFAGYIRNKYGDLYAEAKRFLDHTIPDRDLAEKCSLAIEKFDAVLFGEESEKSIKTFERRLAAYHACEQALNEVKAEHDRRMKQLETLRQKQRSGIQLGARELEKLDANKHRPDPEEERRAAEEKKRLQEEQALIRRGQQEVAAKKRREEVAAQLLTI